MVEVSEVLGYLIEVRVRMQRKAECYRPVRLSQHNRCNTFHIFSIDFQSSHLTSFTITHTICEMTSFPLLKSPTPPPKNFAERYTIIFSFETRSRR